MDRALVALGALGFAACATLDTSRPIETTGFSILRSAEQDGHTLAFWGTRRQLLDFEVSRLAARRSLTESYVGGALALGGLGLFTYGVADKRHSVENVGLGVMVLSVIPSLMASHDYLRAVDLYNTRFPQATSGPEVTLVPYLAVDGVGGTAGVAGRF